MLIQIPCDGVFVVTFFKTIYKKTIIGFGFCDVLNYQGLGKCYQPGVCSKTRTEYLRMADADGKMQIENADGNKNADNKKSKRKKTRNADGKKKKKKKINKQTINERNISFKSLSHGWTLQVHTERETNSWHSFVPCNSFY